MNHEDGKKFVFGVLIDWFEAPYQKEIFRGIEDYCASNNIIINRIIIGALNSPRPWERNRKQVLDFLTTDLFNGIIVYGGSLGNYVGLEDIETIISSFNIPAIIIDSYSAKFPYVIPDNSAGFSELLRHLFDSHGYRRPLYMSGPGLNPVATIRLTTFEQTCSSHHIQLEDQDIVPCDYTREGAHRLIFEMGSKKLRTYDVIVCANDDMAIGSIIALNEMGIIVPADIAVTGIDNISLRLAQFSPLTTVNLAPYQMGYLGAENLHLGLSGGKPAASIVLPMFPVFRSSCGCLLNSQKEVSKALPKYYFTEKERIMLEEFIATLCTKKFPDDAAIYNRQWSSIIWSLMNSGRNADFVHRALSAIRNEVFSRTGTDHEKETFFHQLQIASTAGIMMRENIKIYRNELEESSVDLFAASLEMATLMVKQSTRFREFLEKSGIDGAIIAYVSQTSDGSQKTAIVHSFGDQILESLNGIEFPSERFWNTALVESFRKKDWHIEVLEDGDEVLGWVALSLSNRHFLYSRFIRICVTTLKASRYYEQVSMHAELLEKEVSQRTKDLKELNRVLKAEVLAKEEAEENLKQALNELKNSNDKLRHLSLKDDLTGLYNRRGFLALAEKYFDTIKRRKKEGLIFFVDLDGLKIVNDEFGHAEGDFCITTAAGLLRQCFREEDIIARLGGDEFTILSLYTQHDTVAGICERLRCLVDDFNVVSGKPYLISMSVGWAILNHESESIEATIEEADTDQYEQKRNKIKKIIR